MLQSRGIGGGIIRQRFGPPSAGKTMPSAKRSTAQTVVVALAPTEEQIDRTVEQRSHQVRPLRELGRLAEKGTLLVRRPPPTAGVLIAGDEELVAGIDLLRRAIAVSGPISVTCRMY